MQQKNIPLIVGVTIPVLMIFFVLGSIYVPGWFVQPQYDFLYMTVNPAGGCWQNYPVANQRLVYLERSHFSKGECIPTFYIHETETDMNTQLTFEEAKQLTLDGSNVSPDGFQLEYGRRDDALVIFGGGTDYKTVYLVGRNVSKRITVNTVGDYKNYQFLGWVLPSHG
jgi:hypothetical protein